MDSRVQLLDSRSFSVELGFRIPIVSGILDFYGCIPDSKAQDSGFRSQVFQDCGIRIPLHGEKDTHGAYGTVPQHTDGVTCCGVLGDK